MAGSIRDVETKQLLDSIDNHVLNKPFDMKLLLRKMSEIIR